MRRRAGRPRCDPLSWRRPLAPASGPGRFVSCPHSRTLPCFEEEGSTAWTCAMAVFSPSVFFTATEACQWPPSDPYRASELR